MFSPLGIEAVVHVHSFRNFCFNDMFGEKHQSEMAVLVLDVCIILQVYFYLSYDRIFLKSMNEVLEE